MAAQAAAFLQVAGIATALPRTAWDASDVLSDGSIFREVLHTLIGYTDQPTQLQLVVYLATLLRFLP
jgi:high-affinity iron transporter